MTDDKKKDRILILDDALGAQLEEALGRMLEKEGGVVVVDIDALNPRLRGAFVEAVRALHAPVVRREEALRGLKEMAERILVPVAAPPPRKKQQKPVPRKKKGIINPRGQRRG